MPRSIAESSVEPRLPAKYVPSEHEDGIRARWDASGAFHADPGKVLSGEKKPYCILIPPPNVTGRLHLGHALNNSLQDILVRAHRMMGFETLWMPGTDHAAISTQAVVDKRLIEAGEPALKDYKRLEAEGKKGREQFLKLVMDWSKEYEGAITEQLKLMGCSCDWARQRFTMDEVCARAVREAFFRLFKDGLIYRGKRLVNWDPATQTALADDEVEMQEIDGHFYYMKYPVIDDAGKETGEFVTVATTRPETYLGDTAVAVNPGDPERAKFIGKKVLLPFVGRVIPVIGDDYVVKPDPKSTDAKAQYASGFLKVTPAHDPNDWDIGLRHNLEVINVMGPDAAISDQHGWTDTGDAKQWVGLSREDARRRIVRAFKDSGLLEKQRDYRHSVGHSYRSHVPIEPWLSDQWYCKVTDEKLVGWAQEAVGGDDSSSSSSSSSGAGVSPAFGIPERLSIHQRRLPHWQLGGSTYFVTFRVASGALTDSERQLVVDACFHFDGDRADVHLVVVMPDHVHVLISPRERSAGEWWSLQDLMHSVKSYTSHEIGKGRGGGAVWQEEYFDRLVRDEDEFREKWNYMLMNPVKARMCSGPGEYAFTRRGEWKKGGRDARPTEGEPESKKLIHFHPERYEKTYTNWHENLRDWCISRQLWWGHRIPVWRKEVKSADIDRSDTDRWEKRGYACLMTDTEIMICLPPISGFDCTGDWVSAEEEEASVIRELEEYGFRQDPDVLDTWFSSGLWPMSTMGWPDAAQAAKDTGIGDMSQLLEAFNPTDVLSTAREIITLWVSRMVMFNRYFLQVGGRDARPTGEGDEQGKPGRVPGRVPYRDVFIHAMIQDGEGRKMSKSLGNGVDPLDIIETHGADGMRFTLCHMTTNTQDVRMPVERNEKTGKGSSAKFDLGRNFVTKLFNAARFAISKLDEAETRGTETVMRGELSLVDRWMLSRLARTVQGIEESLKSYAFNDIATQLYDVLWRDYCDWYLESVKPTVSTCPRQQAVLRQGLDVIVRILHPVCPFVTELLYEQLKGVRAGDVEGITLGDAELCCIAPWPKVDTALVDEEAEATFESLRGLTEAMRQLRAQHGIGFKTPIVLFTDEATKALIERGGGVVETLANIERVATEARVSSALPFTHDGTEHAIFAEGQQTDTAALKAQVAETIAKLEKDVNALEGRLKNTGYTDKAPAHLVQQTRDQLVQKQNECDAAKKRLGELE